MSSSLLFQRGKELKARLANIKETIQKNQEYQENYEEFDIPEDSIGTWTYVSPEGIKQEGKLTDFKIYKPKTLMFPDGMPKDGGEIFGEGTVTFPDGKIYKGQFKNGKFHGQGTMIFPSGSKYTGDFKKDRREGHGTMVYPNGFKYVGQFVNNKPNGQGILIFPDDTKYEGQFKNGKFHGQGTITFRAGAQYVGQFKDDKRHGHGSMTYPNGFKYIGQFINNRTSGQGMLTFPDGTKYVGQFKNDKRHGQGAISYPNGLKYTGQFKNEKYHGHGTLTFPDGTQYEGQFEEDKYHGHGTLIFPDGMRYEGQFADNKYHGNGTLIFPDDSQVIGRFVNGKLQDRKKTDDNPGTEIKANRTSLRIRVSEHVEVRDNPQQHEDNPAQTHTEPEKRICREKSERTFRATDGHYVRSKTEILVDNWLFMMGIVHVYERRLPIEEKIYSNFYLPNGNVYIECWSHETDSECLDRKKEKIKVYKKYDFNLIELDDDAIDNLDNILPEKLLSFGIQMY